MSGIIVTGRISEGVLEERYKIGDRKALSVGTTDKTYTFTTPPAVIILYFEGDDYRYDFDKSATDADSPKAPKDTFLALNVKDVSSMVFKGLATGGTVYILTLIP